MTQMAAVLYVVTVAGVIVFQFCLIAGAPWGRLTQGGRYDRALPAQGRVAAGLSVVVLGFMGAGIASAAGLPPNWLAWTAWTALALQALSTIMNWITPSRSEKLLWGPVTSVMLGLAVFVVLSST